MKSDSVFLDTNVLLHATDPARAAHREATAVFDEWPGRGLRLCTSGQIIREYLVVATRPAAKNGLGLTLADALLNRVAFLARTRLLDEDSLVGIALVELLKEVPCTGKQIHDANLVATMVRHRIPVLLSQNRDDFRRFESRIEVRALQAG